MVFWYIGEIVHFDMVKYKFALMIAEMMSTINKMAHDVSLGSIVFMNHNTSLVSHID
mgnify:CR=1 FL=1